MKKILSISALILFSIVLVSCGSNEDKSKTSKKAQMTVNLENGKVVYNKTCIACHMTGVAGAAAVTDKPRWEEVAVKGMDALHKSVIDGIPAGKYGVMAAKGSCVDCSDQDLYDAVGYMLKEAGVTAKQ